MKNLTQFISENTSEYFSNFENNNRRPQSIDHAHDMVESILDREYKNNNHPIKPTIHQSFLTKHVWNNFSDAATALSNSLFAQQHATGSLTGKKGEKELSDEERITEGDRVFHRHEPVFKDLASQHHDFVRHLYSINPMFKTHIDTLKNHYGADLEKISHNLFSDTINAKTQALITHFAFNTSMRPIVSTGELEDTQKHIDSQNFFIKANNKAVAYHKHPLGLLFEGGPQFDFSQTVGDSNHWQHSNLDLKPKKLKYNIPESKWEQANN
jgi:hypothetical protein